MATVHITESEAVRDLPALLARVRSGEEIVIETEASPAVVLRVAASEPRGRLLSESIADGTIRSGHRVLSVAFGSGLTWGAALIRW